MRKRWLALVSALFAVFVWSCEERTPPGRPDDVGPPDDRGRGRTGTTTAGEAGHAHLILGGDEVGNWTAMANTFTVLGHGSASRDSVYFRSGILVQLAEYDHYLDYVYDGIEIYAGGQDDPAWSIPRGEFHWVDIVSPFPKHPKTPIQDAEAFALYPNSVYVDSCEVMCEFPDDDWKRRCMRDRRLHARILEVKSLVTYWQGAGGWQLHSAPRAPGLSNSHRFRFADPFTVRVMTPDEASASWTEVWKGSNVDSVLVKLTPQPPDKGEKQDPPWVWP